MIRKIGTVARRSSRQIHDRTPKFAFRAELKPTCFQSWRYVMSTETLPRACPAAVGRHLLQLVVWADREHVNSGDFDLGVSSELLLWIPWVVGCQAPMTTIQGGCRDQYMPGLESQPWALLQGLLQWPGASRSFSVFKTSRKY